MSPEIKPKHLILMGAVGLGGYLIYKRVTAPPPVAPPAVAPPPVAPPAVLRVTDISVTPTVVGESTEIIVTVENPTDAAGSALVSITVDGREIERLDTGTVEPGASTMLTLTWTPPRVGTFEVCAEVA